MATTHVPDTGNPVTNMTNLQTAVNAAVRGDTITLAPRVIYRGTLTLPAKSGTTPIIITTSQPSGLPTAGTRLTPRTVASQLAVLPILEVGANNAPALKTCDPSAGVSSYYTMRGLEFQANAFGGVNIVSLGSANSLLANLQDTAAKVPSDLILDRCYIHGLPFSGQHRGVSLDCFRSMIVECWIDDCWGIAQDTQSIGGSNGLGTYTIRNNYIGGATENFLMGGSPPIIPGLVPANLIFTRNDLTRPIAWFDPVRKTSAPILGTPANVVVNTGGTGGTLPAATYDYRIVARVTSYQNNIASSNVSTVVSRTITAGQLPQVSWSGVTGATSYFVYRTGPVDTQRFSVTTLSFSDSGAAGTTTAIPTAAGTQRFIKNLFELKCWNTASVYGNRLSHHWPEAQVGFAVVLTPANPEGGNDLNQVIHIEFAYNWLQKSAGGFNMTSHDAGAGGQVSARTTDINIHHNLLTEIGTVWGNNQLREFATAVGNSSNIFEGINGLIYEHNTVLGTGMNSCAFFSDKHPTLGTFPQHTGFIYRNNLTRRGSFGIIGGGLGEGTVSLNAYCATPYTVTKNAMVGVNLGLYPAGNYNPTEATFEAQFTNYLATGGVPTDFQLAAASIYKGQATDGTDLGCEPEVMDALYAGTVTPPFSVTWAKEGGSGTLYVTTEGGCDWSAVSTVPWVTITNGASHTGTGTVTYTVSSNPGSARQGVIRVAGTTVTIVQVGGGVALVPVPVGALALAGRAPTAGRSYVATPGPGALTLAGAAASDLVTAPTAVLLAPPKGTLTIAGLAPSLTGTAVLPPGVGALTLLGRAPVGQLTQAISPGVGALTLAGLAVIRAATGSAAPGVGALVLLGRAPTRSLAQFPILGLGTLVLTGQAPTRIELVPRVTGVGALAFAGLAPTIPQAHIPPVGVGALSLLGLAPTGQRTYLAAPPAGALILLSIPGGAGTLFSMVPEVGRLVLAGLVPTIPQVLIVAPGVGALVVAGLAPVRAADTKSLMLVGTLTLTGHLIGNFATVSALPPAGALTLLGRAPTLTGVGVVLPDVGALVLAGLAPSQFGTGTVAPSTGTLTLAGLAPALSSNLTFPGAVGALLLTGRTVAVVISGGVAVTVVPSQAALVLSGLAPGVMEAVLIAVPCGALVFDSTVPPVYACQATVTPTLITSTAVGGTTIVTVTIGALCPWTAVSLDSWLTVTPADDVGPGAVVVTIAPFTGTVDPREGALDIAGTRVVVVQIASGCTFVVTPSSVHASAMVTVSTLAVATTTGCAWTATTDTPWITLTGASGTGSGSVTYALTANLLPSARHGIITVAGQQIPVRQLGANAGPGPRECPEI